MIFNSLFLVSSAKRKQFFTLSILSFSLLITNACSQLNQKGSGSGSAGNVDIFIQPNGEKPLIVRGDGGTKICRRGELPPDTFYGLARNEVAVQEAGQEAGQEGDAANQPQLTQALTTTTAGEDWFKMGLLIVNKRTDWFLLIENLEFVITAPWGDELLSHRTHISSGYCRQPEHLYIIPPTPKNKQNSYTGNLYQPFQSSAVDKYVNNLTLYVSGVPIPKEAPTYKEDDSSSTALKQIRATGQRQTPTAPKAFVLTYLPPYTVQLSVTGRWIDKDRVDKGNFARLIRFSLFSRFLN